VLIAVLLLNSSSPHANEVKITSDMLFVLPPEGAAYQVGGGAG
jgi:hypothetical protein